LHLVSPTALQSVSAGDAGPSLIRGSGGGSSQLRTSLSCNSLFCNDLQGIQPRRWNAPWPWTEGHPPNFRWKSPYSEQGNDGRPSGTRFPTSSGMPTVGSAPTYALTGKGAE
jgi:hypothetical protein